MDGPGHVLQEQVYHLGHFRLEPFAVDVKALLLRVWCPAHYAAAASAEELASVIHGVSQSAALASRHKLNLTEHVRRDLVV